MSEPETSFEFLPDYRRASSELRASKVSTDGWQSVYYGLMSSLQLLLLRIVTDLNIDVGDRWTLGLLRQEIGQRNIMPPVLYQSLDVLIQHRNMLVHAQLHDSEARNYLPDLDAVHNLALWYLTDFEKGPCLSRIDAEKLLKETSVKQSRNDAEKLLKETSVKQSRKSKSIFLSYAREDENKASKVYDVLNNRGHKPWMDKRELVAGQDWKLEIRKAIERSQYFVALLSKKSVGKRGFVQKEIHFALEVLGEIPIGQIYFIPVRLEQCEVPQAIRDLHWIDLTDDNYRDLFLSVEHE